MRQKEARHMFFRDPEEWPPLKSDRLNETGRNADTNVIRNIAASQYKSLMTAFGEKQPFTRFMPARSRQMAENGPSQTLASQT